jgi:hypothetical protein
MNEQINMKFTVNELNLILEGLGNMAYYRVHELIHKIHSQAQEQVQNLASASASHTENAQPALKTSNGVHAD